MNAMLAGGALNARYKIASEKRMFNTSSSSLSLPTRFEKSFLCTLIVDGSVNIVVDTGQAADWPSIQDSE